MRRRRDTTDTIANVCLGIAMHFFFVSLADSGKFYHLRHFIIGIVFVCSGMDKQDFGKNGQSASHAGVI